MIVKSLQHHPKKKYLAQFSGTINVFKGQLKPDKAATTVLCFILTNSSDGDDEYLITHLHSLGLTTPKISHPNTE
jgi:ABC-type Fe3+/spermidine/putrescine transport system ATPase subunit